MKLRTLWGILFLIWIVLFMAIFAALLSTKAHSAEARLPITVRILDCKSVEKAAEECKATKRCCDIWERKKKEK